LPGRSAGDAEMDLDPLAFGVFMTLNAGIFYFIMAITDALLS
jgi:hypothetical protein